MSAPLGYYRHRDDHGPRGWVARWWLRRRRRRVHRAVDRRRQGACARCREDKPLDHVDGPLCADCWQRLLAVAAKARRGMGRE